MNLRAAFVCALVGWLAGLRFGVGTAGMLVGFTVGMWWPRDDGTQRPPFGGLAPLATHHPRNG